MLDQQLQMLSFFDLEKIQNKVRDELRRRRKEERSIRRYYASKKILLLQSDIEKEIKKEIQTASPSKKIPSEERYQIYRHNSLNLLSIPGVLTHKYTSVQQYLPCLFWQSWEFLYYGFDKDNKYYVYAHIDPRGKAFITSEEAGGNYGGVPIYIGKGTGNRAYDMKRNQGHGKILRQILNKTSDKKKVVKIIRNNLSESQAYEIEAKLIYFFGTVYDEKRKHGILYNLDRPQTPNFHGRMEKMPGLARAIFHARVEKEQKNV